MYSFMFNVKLPSNMSLEDSEKFFNDFNARVNDLISQTEKQFNDAMPVSTYVIDDTDGRPVV